MTMRDSFILNASEPNCSSGTIQINSSTIQINSSGMDSGGNLETNWPLSSLAERFQESIAIIPVEALGLFILVLIILINGLVLTALFKVSHKALQAKFLLIGCLIAHVAFPLSSKGPTSIIWICMACGLKDPLTFACLELITWIVPPLALLAQGSCTLSLACDRVYAVCFPLVYKTKGYSRPVKFIIIFSQLFLCFALLLPAIILPLHINRSPVDFCTRLIPGYYLYTRIGFAIYLFTITIVTFALYAFIFVHLKRKTLFKEAERHGEVSRKSTSLTIVYFLAHLTTVILSIPVSVYSVYIDVVLKVPSTGNTFIVLYLLAILLYLNSMIDPLMLTWKIPAIRKNLPFHLNICVSRSRGVSSNPSSSAWKSDIHDGEI